MVCREASRAASAARTATVFPAPTSPVMTPMWCSVDAPGDPGDGFGVGGVAVQHPGGEVPAERRAGEPEVRLQSVDHDSLLSATLRVRGGHVGEQVELAGDLLGSLAGAAGRAARRGRRS